MPLAPRTPEEYVDYALAFWHARVIRRSGCWGWAAGRCKDGYGFVYVGRKHARATHVAWFSVHGEFPAKGMSVLHRCDNPECTNPEHLFLGTGTANMQDRAKKNRDKLTNGMHFNSKATPEQVRYLRANWPAKPVEVLMVEVGLSRAATYKIAAGKTHKSII